MNKDHLDIAILVMQDVVKRELSFDMGYFADSYAWQYLDYGKPVPMSCNTPGCCIGHVCGDERGKATGIYLQRVQSWHGVLPRYKDLEDMPAIAEWAGIEEFDAEILFGAHQRTARQELDLLLFYRFQGRYAAFAFAYAISPESFEYLLPEGQYA